MASDPLFAFDLPFLPLRVLPWAHFKQVKVTARSIPKVGFRPGDPPRCMECNILGSEGPEPLMQCFGTILNYKRDSQLVGCRSWWHPGCIERTERPSHKWICKTCVGDYGLPCPTANASGLELTPEKVEEISRHLTKDQVAHVKKMFPMKGGMVKNKKKLKRYQSQHIESPLNNLGFQWPHDMMKIHQSGAHACVIRRGQKCADQGCSPEEVWQEFLNGWVDWIAVSSQIFESKTRRLKPDDVQGLVDQHKSQKASAKAAPSVDQDQSHMASTAPERITVPERFNDSRRILDAHKDVNDETIFVPEVYLGFEKSHTQKVINECSLLNQITPIMKLFCLTKKDEAEIMWNLHDFGMGILENKWQLPTDLEELMKKMLAIHWQERTREAHPELPDWIGRIDIDIMNLMDEVERGPRAPGQDEDGFPTGGATGGVPKDDALYGTNPGDFTLPEQDSSSGSEEEVISNTSDAKQDSTAGAQVDDVLAGTIPATSGSFAASKSGAGVAHGHNFQGGAVQGDVPTHDTTVKEKTVAAEPPVEEVANTEAAAKPCATAGAPKTEAKFYTAPDVQVRSCFFRSVFGSLSICPTLHLTYSVFRTVRISGALYFAHSALDLFHN